MITEAGILSMRAVIKCSLLYVSLYLFAVTAPYTVAQSNYIEQAQDVENDNGQCRQARSHQLILSGMFKDHAVIQLSSEAPVWGEAAPGMTVHIEFNGTIYEVITDECGKWRTTINASVYGGPHQMIVSGDGQTVIVNDLYVGEVWLCGGQSNMQWSVAQSGNADAEIMAAEWPQLRIYSMPLNVATDPTHLALGDWAVCTPDSIADYSAVAYYFGRELHQKLDVPVGLILIAWGGTPAEAWTSHETLSSNPALRILDDRYRQYLEQHPDIVTAYQNASSRYEELNGVGEMMGKASDRSPPSAYAMSARYRYYLSKLRIAGESQLPYGPAHFRSPSSLFNGMLCPAAPYKVRGVVWYQGESNVGEPNIYRRLLPAMIKDWRSLWGDVGLPFGIVQLANVGPVQVDPDEESSWADVRDVQRVVAHELANIGLIVTIDIGDEELVHAPNKQEVGRRLALWSMAKVYNEDNYYSGPVPIDAIIEGSTVILTFDHTEGGLVTSDSQAISGFTLAGNDGIYHWASATIQADDKLTISSPNVHRPTIVRYRWAENPIGNLTNNSGLPATPFQLDLMK